MKKLYKIEEKGKLGGVCAGFSEIFNIDVTLLRVIILLTFIYYGIGFIPYVILWCLLPDKSNIY